ncbi:unnamed protein product [Sphagnum tenellum]
MEAGECSKEIDPGDPELGRSPTERHDSCNGATNAIENMPQDPSRPEMANEINMSSGDRCDEGKKMMEQPGSQGVAQESDDLSILGDQPTSYSQTPVSTPSQERTVRVSYDKDRTIEFVSMDEFITTLRESQLETLQFSFHGDELASSRWDRKHRLEVIGAVSTCESLKELSILSRLDVEEVEILCENLVSHPMLATLWVIIVSAGTGGDGSEKAMEIVSNMLKNNCTIKSLQLNTAHGTEIGGASLGAMLSVNSTLETLVVGTIYGISKTGVELVLAPLTGHDGKPPLNKSLKKLTLHNWEIGQRGARAAAQMLRTNDSLTHLGFESSRFSDPLDVCTILESLETNETLHTLDLAFCEAVGGDVVLAKMMDLLRANPWLKDIDLYQTPLERDGHAVQVKAQLEMNSRDYMAVVKGMRRVQPKFARVFLCGDAYSGKTTLRRSMVRSFLQGCQGKMVIPLIEENGQNSMRIFVPTTLKPNGFVAQGERSLEWTFNEFTPETSIIHLGRRLQCYDQELTTFTPGFFPRAQVALYNHFVKHLRPKANSYKSEKNLSKILIDGIGDMIPNFGKGLSLALDTNALQDYFPSDGIQKILEHESFEGKRSLIEQGTALNKAQEKNSAEQWLVHFLKERKRSISESFGLTRVKYHKKNNKGPLIRWVCHKCRDDGFRKQMLEDFPV